MEEDRKKPPAFVFNAHTEVSEQTHKDPLLRSAGDDAARAAIDDCVVRAGTAARPYRAGGDAHGRESNDEDPAKVCSARHGGPPCGDNCIRTN